MSETSHYFSFSVAEGHQVSLCSDITTKTIVFISGVQLSPRCIKALVLTWVEAWTTMLLLVEVVQIARLRNLTKLPTFLKFFNFMRISSFPFFLLSLRKIALIYLSQIRYLVCLLLPFISYHLSKVSSGYTGIENVKANTTLCITNIKL